MENEKIVVMQKKSTLLLYIISLIFACVLMVWLVFNIEVGDGGSRTERLFLLPSALLREGCFLHFAP